MYGKKEVNNKEKEVNSKVLVSMDVSVHVLGAYVRMYLLSL